MSRLVFVILFFCALSISAQNIRLQGEVYDTDGNAISYASVAIEGASYGTVSNLNGGFDLIIRNEDFDKNVAISFVGYNTSYIPVDTSLNHKVILVPKSLELPSAFVLGFDAIELIKRFLKKKSLNYPTSPIVHKMFLREHEKTVFGDDIYLSEILVDYLRYDYVSTRKDKIRIVKGRNFRYMNFDSIGYTQPSGGFFDISHDLVKYPNAIVDVDKVSKYEYNVESAYEEEDRLVYKVKFTPIAKKAYYEGYLYIEDKSFALVKAEIGYDAEGMKWLNHSSWSADVDWKSMKKIVTYKKQTDGKFRLAEIVIIGEGNNYMLNEEFISHTELITVESDSKNIEEYTFTPIDKYVSVGDLSFENTLNFWEGNNYIKQENQITSVTEPLLDVYDPFK